MDITAVILWPSSPWGDSVGECLFAAGSSAVNDLEPILIQKFYLRLSSSARNLRASYKN